MKAPFGRRMADATVVAAVAAPLGCWAMRTCGVHRRRGMSAVRARAWTRRPARRLAILLAVLVVGGAVAAHHAMPEMPAIGAAATCLAVLGSAVVAVGLIAPRRRLAVRTSDH